MALDGYTTQATSTVQTVSVGATGSISITLATPASSGVTPNISEVYFPDAGVSAVIQQVTTPVGGGATSYTFQSDYIPQAGDTVIIRAKANLLQAAQVAGILGTGSRLYLPVTDAAGTQYLVPIAVV